MNTYYKATRPDGTSFHDSKTKWEVGETTAIPEAERKTDLCGAGILHASTEKAETLLGGSWPCRLFEVEGEPVTEIDGHKLGFHELTVVKELPAWAALGPNGQEVAALIEQAKSITPEQAKELAAAWDAARYAARDAARDTARYAARYAARDAAWDAARYAARDAAWDAARYAARYAARDAAAALLTRDLITEAQFNALYDPWHKVMGDSIVRKEA